MDVVLKGRRFAAAGMALLALGIAVVAWFAPAERSLGEVAKLVYVHGALVWSGLAMYTIAAIFGIALLIDGGEAVHRWVRSSETTAIALWFAYVTSSVFLMKAAWGGVLLSEPRFVVATQVLGIALVAAVIGRLPGVRRLEAGLTVAVTAFLWLRLSTAGYVLHPKNPVGESPSLWLKATFGILVLLFLGLAALAVHLQTAGAGAGTEVTPRKAQQ